MIFRKTKPLKPSRVEFSGFVPEDVPSGICIKTEKGVWLVLNGTRYAVKSQRVLDSWEIKALATSSEESLLSIPKAPLPIGFRDGTLVKRFTSGELYFVSQGELHQVDSPDILAWLNLSPTDAIVISEDEFKIIKIGKVLK